MQRARDAAVERRTHEGGQADAEIRDGHVNDLLESEIAQLRELGVREYDERAAQRRDGRDSYRPCRDRVVLVISEQRAMRRVHGGERMTGPRP